MDRWQKFLDSLATRGGQLLVLLILVLTLMGLVLHVLHNSDNVQATDVIMNTFSAFSGALLGFLTGQAMGQRKTDTPPEAK